MYDYTNSSSRSGGLSTPSLQTLKILRVALQCLDASCGHDEWFRIGAGCKATTAGTGWLAPVIALLDVDADSGSVRRGSVRSRSRQSAQSRTHLQLITRPHPTKFGSRFGSPLRKQFWCSGAQMGWLHKFEKSGVRVHFWGARAEIDPRGTILSVARPMA